MKQTKNQTVYVRKGSQATLRELSEKSRLSQSEILADWLGAIQVILDKCPEGFDRLTIASYPSSNSKMVQTLLAPILCESLQFEATNIDAKDEILSEKAVRKDILSKVSKP